VTGKQSWIKPWNLINHWSEPYRSGMKKGPVPLLWFPQHSDAPGHGHHPPVDLDLILEFSCIPTLRFLNPTWVDLNGNQGSDPVTHLLETKLSTKLRVLGSNKKRTTGPLGLLIRGWHQSSSSSSSMIFGSRRSGLSLV
jgi:hypothetical protein